MTKESAPRKDLHTEITNQLIASIEAHPGEFSLPWRRNAGALHMPVNALTGNRYNGINILSLWVAAEARGYAARLQRPPSSAACCSLLAACSEGIRPPGENLPPCGS